MKNDNLNAILNELAENAAPTSRIDLWPTLKDRLAMSESRLKQGDASMKTDSSRTLTLRWAALFLIAIAIAFTILFATPQGRAWAQKMFLFFTVAEDKSFPIPTEQVFAVPATATSVPTYTLPLQPVGTTVEPTKPSELLDRTCASPEAQASYFCQITAVETQAGFDAMEFPLDPKGMKFSKVTFDPGQQVFETEFVVISGGGYLYLRQGNGDFLSGNGWDQSPADAIEQVTVNGNYAELVSGGFMVYPEATEAVWEPGGPLRLRWRDGERWFSLEKMGDPYPIEWMDKNKIVKLAESLVTERQLDKTPPVDPEYLTSVEAAEKLAGVDVPVPTLLPENYELKRVVWADNVVRQIYGPKNSTENTLFIFMGSIADQKVGPCSDCPPGTDEVVQVGPWQGWYSRGIFEYGNAVEGQPTPTPVWQADARHWQLVWNTETLWVNMFFIPSNAYGGEMDKETMLAIARSLK